MTTKLAVPPAPPALVVATTIPETWQDAFIHMTDRFMKVIGKQAATIKDLVAGLEDARGVIAAGDRARADLLAKLDGLQAAFDVHDKAVKAQAERITNLDSFSSTVEAHGKTIAELLTVSEQATKVFKAIDDVTATTKERIDLLDESMTTTAERITSIEDRVEQVDAVVREQVASVDDRFVEVSDLVGKVGAQIGLDIAAISRTADEDRQAVRVLGEQVDQRITGLAGDLDQETKARAAAIAAVASSVNDLSETASEQDAELATRVAGLDTRVAGQADGLAVAVTRLDGFRAVADTVEAVRREVQANALAIDDDRARMGKIEEAVEGFVRVTVAAGAEIKTFDVRLTDLAKQAADACHRVTIMSNQMPSAVMVDRNGHLQIVARSGEQIDLGKVIGETKDGKDAADVVAARVDGDRLIFTRSDRTEFGCSIAALVPPVPVAPKTDTDPTKLGYLSKDAKVRSAQVDDMKKMRADKKTYDEIAKKYQASARTVIRLIKGDGDEG